MSKLFFSGENSPNLVEISPHLVRSLLKSGWDLPKSGINLVGSRVIWPKTRPKKLESPAFCKSPVGSVEAGFRGENPPTDPPDSISRICNLRPTTRAHGSVAGGSVLVRYGRLDWVRVWLDRPNLIYFIT